MKTSLIIGLTCAALLAGPAAYAQTAPAAKKKAAKPAVRPAGASVSATLMANEKQMLDAIVTHDAKAFFALVAPGTVTVNASGYATIEDYRKSFDQMKAESQTATGMKVISLGSNTMLVTYKLDQAGTYMGQPFPPVVYATTIWKNKNAKWVAVFHQESTAAKR
jgi:hypothetical protein